MANKNTKTVGIQHANDSNYYILRLAPAMEIIDDILSRPEDYDTNNNRLVKYQDNTKEAITLFTVPFYRCLICTNYSNVDITNPNWVINKIISDDRTYFYIVIPEDNILKVHDDITINIPKDSNNDDFKFVIGVGF